MWRSSSPRSSSGRADLHADDLRLLLTGVEPSPDDQDGVVLDQGAVLGHGLREDEHLHRRLQVLEHEAGHELALLRVGPPQVGHHAPDRPHRATGRPTASSSRMSESVQSVCRDSAAS